MFFLQIKAHLLNAEGCHLDFPLGMRYSFPTCPQLRPPPLERLPLKMAGSPKVLALPVSSYLVAGQGEVQRLGPLSGTGQLGEALLAPRSVEGGS